MARRDPGYRPLVLADSEPRSSAGTLGHPRDPALAEWFGAYAATTSGVNVTADNARHCVEVDACVSLLENTLATVPLGFYERVDETERRARPDSPLFGLLNDRPNGWQTSAEFRQMMEGYRQTHGKAYARIVAGPSGPIALEPEHPLSMRPFRVSNGGLNSIAYQWTPPDGPTRILLQHEVLHLKDGPARRFNMVDTEGKVERHRDDIGLLMATGEYLARFFSNNATPKSVFKVPTGISDEAAEKLRESYERRHRGLENQHRVGILDGGLDIVPLGINNDEAQVIQAHSLAVAKVARAWGVPGFLIGETGDVSNFGTGIEQRSIGFITYYMRPNFVVWEQALDVALMSDTMRRRFFFSFDMDGLQRGDFKTRMEGYALQIQWGVCTPNEIRRQMNLSPLPGGDERWMPLNMVPATEIMNVLLKTGPQQTQREMLDGFTRALTDFAHAVRDPKAGA